MQQVLNDSTARLQISVLKVWALSSASRLMFGRKWLGEQFLRTQWAGNLTKVTRCSALPNRWCGRKELKQLPEWLLPLHPAEFQIMNLRTVVFVLKSWEKDGHRSYWNVLESENATNCICLAYPKETERGLLSVIFSKGSFDVVRGMHNTNKWLQSKFMWA